MKIHGPWLTLSYFCLAGVVFSFNIAALTAVIPAISRSLHLSSNDAAMIIPFYMIPYGICALLYVALASRISIRRLMISGCLLFSLGHCLSLWMDSFPVILWGRVVAGIGASAVMPLALITIGNIFKKEVRGRVLGLFFGCSFLGAMLGLMVSAVAVWHWLFVVPAISGFVLAIAFLACPQQGLEANPSVRVNYAKAFRMGGLRRILFFIFILSLLFNAGCKWYGVFLDKVYGYNQITISGLIILTTLAGAIGQVLGGFITDRWGRLRGCVFGIAVMGLCMMTLSQHYPLWGIALVLSSISVGWAMAHNAISTLLTDFSDSCRFELAALNSSVRFFSGGLGFMLSGNFMQQNFGLTFFVIGFIFCMVLFSVPRIMSGQKRCSLGIVENQVF